MEYFIKIEKQKMEEFCISWGKSAIFLGLFFEII